LATSAYQGLIAINCLMGKKTVLNISYGTELANSSSKTG